MPEKKQKTPCVPRLRFSEFQDAGEWEVRPLRKLATRRTERNRDGKLKCVLTNSAEHGVVDQRDYFDKDIANRGNLGNYFVVDKGDFVYNPRISSFAPVGPISRNTVAKGVMSPLYTVFRFKQSDTSFYAHYFKSSAWYSYMRKVGSTGARHDRMAISNDDFMAMPLPIPPPKEQQKIADCLSSLDEVIEAQSKKIEALKTHKKGLMQNLFPREGETTPRLRFPEFRDAGEWEMKRLGDVGPVSMCKRILKLQTAESGDIPFYKIGTFGNKADGYITKEIYEEYKERYSFPNKGDILISASGTIGRTVVYDGEPAYFQDSNIVWIANDQENVLNTFLLHCYQIIKWQTDDNTISRLYNDNLRKMKILVPSIPEQQRIADCLSSLDALIEAQTKKIEALKTHKKGLMQQLFPQEVA